MFPSYDATGLNTVERSPVTLVDIACSSQENFVLFELICTKKNVFQPILIES